MNQTPAQPPAPERNGPQFIDEADVGSGEKNPGQHDTEDMIEQVGQSLQQQAPAAPPPAAQPAIQPAEDARRAGKDG